MEDDPDEITKLLRLKRFEQPQPEYFERFLEEFKDRQRAELLRVPAWRIAWERAVAFLGEQMPARIGYGFASTAVLVAAAIASFHILESRPVEIIATAPAAPQSPPAQTASLDFGSQVQLPDLPSLAHTASFTTPRYVMDARPVSYEPPSSF